MVSRLGVKSACCVCCACPPNKSNLACSSWVLLLELYLDDVRSQLGCDRAWLRATSTQLSMVCRKGRYAGLPATSRQLGVVGLPVLGGNWMGSGCIWYSHNTKAWRDSGTTWPALHAVRGRTGLAIVDRSRRHMNQTSALPATSIMWFLEYVVAGKADN